MNNAELANQRFQTAQDNSKVIDGMLLTASLLLLSFGFLIISFGEGLSHMVGYWGQEEYSHGYMIPLVSLFIFAKQIPDIIATTNRKPSFIGVAILLFSLALLLLGELSSLYSIIQYGFLFALVGLFVTFLGLKSITIIWAALIYLAFMIPLPAFLYNNLSSELQLISSTIGVLVIRLFSISVFLEGNVIDLGNYQLQVVEACSGLRYLFPLMSFGFLVAYLYKAPTWQRCLIFLSTIPITVLMNSFRIGVIGITVNYWGIAAAEGFLHDFEGWVIFISCLGVLLIEIWLLSKITGLQGTISSRLDLDLPEISKGDLSKLLLKTSIPQIAFFLIALLMVPSILALGEREEIVPDRLNFTTLPLIKGKWIGRESGIEENILNKLELSDYIRADYQHEDGGLPINLYVAYYNSQRKGASIHSPRSCIPGGGWRITEFGEKSLQDQMNFSPTAIDTPSTLPTKVNRAVIQQGESRSLAYFWFQQRGRTITNEYLAKWYLFWDSLTLNRTDGALIRVITPIPEDISLEEADKHIISFIKDFNPLLSDYIPD